MISNAKQVCVDASSFNMSLDTQIACNGLVPLTWEVGGRDEVTAVMGLTRPNRRKCRTKCPVLI